MHRKQLQALLDEYIQSKDSSAIHQYVNELLEADKDPLTEDLEEDLEEELDEPSFHPFSEESFPFSSMENDSTEVFLRDGDSYTKATITRTDSQPSELMDKYEDMAYWAKEEWGPYD